LWLSQSLIAASLASAMRMRARKVCRAAAGASNLSMRQRFADRMGGSLQVGGRSSPVACALAEAPAAASPHNVADRDWAARHFRL